MTKNSSFFIRKTPLLFPRKSKVWKLWEIWAKIPCETHSIKILPISAIIKIFKQFFEITHLLSRKSQAVEGFPFSRAIRVFERHSKEKYPCLAFLKTFKCFLKKNISFSKNPTFWTSSEHMSTSELRNAIEKKTCKIRRLRKFSKRFFSRYLFQMHSKKNLPKLASFGKIKFFLGMKRFFFQRNQNLDVLRTFKHYHNLRRISEFFLNFCVFEKIPEFFPKKSQILNVLRIPAQKHNLRQIVHQTWQINHFWQKIQASSSEKPHFFSQENPKFESFEKFEQKYHLRRIQ